MVSSGYIYMYSNMGRLVICFVLILYLSTQCNGDTASWENQARQSLQDTLKVKENKKVAKNVILFIGDGMSMPTITSARIYKGQLNGEKGEDTVFKFEEFPNVALSKTYGSDRQIPDSPQAATAIMSGAKVNFNTLGFNDEVFKLDCNAETPERKLTSILDHFLADGRTGGFVTTARVTHATPAASYAHTCWRKWESDENIPEESKKCKDIAYQFVYDNPDIQVALGGGRRHFLPNTTNDPEYPTKKGKRVDGKNLIEEWQTRQTQRGRRHQYVWNKGQFDAVNPLTTDYLLGMFEDSHMQYEVERDKSAKGEPSITEMVDKAIKILRKNNKGYFLLVEGSNIDIAHHDTLAAKALSETVEMEKAVVRALELINLDETLLIVTADHSHAFLMAGYNYRGNDILGLADPTDYEPPLDGMPYTTLVYGNGPAVDYSLGKRPNLTNVDTRSFDYKQQAAVPLEYETHGGDDVPIYSIGPWSHLLTGVKEEHYIAHVMQYAACVGYYKNDEHCEYKEPPPTCGVGVISGWISLVFFSLLMMNIL